MGRVRTFAAVLLLTLVACELAARAALSTRAYRAALASSLDGRRLASLLAAADARDAHGTASPAGDAWWLPDPDLGWKLRPDTVSGHGFVATVDHDGHRVTPPATRPGPRVLLLGDSFTFGHDVDDADTFAWRLAQASGAPVTNAAVPGYSLDHVVVQLDRDGLELDPDVVIVGLTPMLITRTRLSWDNWAKPWFESTSGGLTLRGTPIPAPDALLDDLHPLRAVELGRLALGRLRGDLRPAELEYTLGPALLDRVVARGEALGARVVVAYLPPAHAVVPDEAQGAALSKATSRDVWLRWCASGPRPCLDLLPDLLALQAEGVVLERGSHWTPEVHARVAARLLPQITPASP